MATILEASTYSKIFWYEAAILPESQQNLYHLTFAYHYKKDLNIGRLKRALQATVNTNYNLRSNFFEKEGKLYQVIHDHVDATLECYTADNKRKHSAILQAQKNKPFDLSSMPLFRFVLIKNKYQSNVTLVLIFHHIILDGTQKNKLMQSISVNYTNPTSLNKTDKNEIYQLKKYLKWEQNNISKANVKYWHAKLKGYNLHNNLPYQRALTDKIKLDPIAKLFQLDNKLYQQLVAFSKKYELSIFNIIKTVIAILISQYSNQKKVVIVYPFNTRGELFKNIKGAFVNTLVYPFEKKGCFIESVNGQTSDKLLRRHRYISIIDVMANLDRNQEGFNVSINQTNLGLNGPKLNGVPSCSSSLSIGSGELSFFYEDTGNDLKYIIYTLDKLFDKKFLNNISRHFRNILKQAIASPETKLSTLSCLDKAEYKNIVYQWNATKTAYPKTKCIHQLFENQVSKTPSNIALVFGDQKLTYRELNKKANRLGHYLQKLGVKLETLVAICVERSFEMVIGLLGILKAGGAYVPLDPSYPKARLQFILKDTQASVLVTKKGLGLLNYAGKVVALDRDWQKIAACSNKAVNSSTMPDNLAYVIYTSGSTGQPKGVMLEHLSVCNHLVAVDTACQLTANDRFLQNASFSFDISVWEIFGPLIAGAIVVLPEKDDTQDSRSLIEVMIREQVTIMDCVPAMLNLLLEEQHFKDTKLRVVTTGYERLPIALKDKLYKVSNAQLYNFYGPTEACIDVTSWTCPRQYIGSVIPIGRPHPNTQVYILTENMQPLPIGVVGELYIGGVGLARGYLNQPKLTAEKFISNPFSKAHKAKLYKTGDLARYLPDGNIEFVGRIDSQVKVRGYRVELGEIETNLIKCSAIKEAVVITREDASGNKRLIAYCVPAKQSKINPDDLSTFLKYFLPEYMLPSLFVFLEQLPVTANGKVDRVVLANMDSSVLVPSQEFVLPQNRKEKILAQIWLDVLGLEAVGINDNFFEVGGDSIISIQIAAKAAAVGLQIKPRDLFEHQTIASLSQVTGLGSSIKAEQGLVGGSVLLTPIQHWFFEKQLPDQHHWNQARLLEVANVIEENVLRKAVEKLIEHHDALRLRFKLSKLGWQQKNSKNEMHDVLIHIDLSTIATDQLPQVLTTISTKWQASLDLENGPIIRAVFFKLATKMSNRLLIAIHHLAVDGVSWRILLEDLQIICEQLHTGQQISLPAKTTSYQRWAQAQRIYADSEALSQEWNYWLEIAKAAKTAQLPLKPRHHRLNTVTEVKHYTVSLSDKETQALLQEVPEAYHTQINDILLLALTKSITAWVGNQSLLLDLEGHGREDISENADISRTVGWFTSIFPVSLTLADQSDLGTQIKSIKEQLRQIPNKGIGYGILRYLSQDKRANKLKSTPAADISFNYLGQFDQVLRQNNKQQKLFSPATESPGCSHSTKGTVTHSIDINGLVEGRQLKVNWSYCPDIIESSVLTSIANNFIKQLQAIIKYCQRKDVGGYMVSDFPQSHLTQAGLDRLLSQNAHVLAGSTQPAQRNIAAIYPLSPLQQGLVFHSLAAPESGVYCTQLYFDFKGKINKRVLKVAWSQVVHQHPILRTLFANLDQDNPLQIVLKEVSIPWIELNLSQDKPKIQGKKLKAYLQKDRAMGFNFGQAPIMRFHLVTLSNVSHQLIWTHHHSLLDGWSVAILKQQFWQAYQAHVKSQKILLENTRPYEDYITWLTDQDSRALTAYWQQTLQGFSAPTPLGVDRRNSDKKDKHGQLEKPLSKLLTHGLYQFARQHQLTPNTVMLGVWSLLLSRYSSEEDVLFGITTAGRPGDLVGVDRMVGLFLNTLPLRVKVPGKAHLVRWLKDLQAQQVRLQDHGSLSLTQIKKLSEVSGDSPLFESLFVFENYPIEELSSAAALGQAQLRLKGEDAQEKAHYPLSIIIVPQESLHIVIKYQKERLADNMIANLLGHIEEIIKGFTSNSEQKLADYCILTKVEKETLLVKWNDTDKVYPKDKCIHQLFEEQVERTPNNTALVFEDQKLTYKELNSRANQLARYLQKLGVRPEILAAVCLERSIEMIIGLLSILKAGGACVPLDPNYPVARLQFMLDDMQAPILLTQEKFVKGLKYPGQYIFLDRDLKVIVKESTKSLKTNIAPTNLAYLIYTSGSTGKPKGVMIEHTALVNYLNWMIKRFNYTTKDRILQSTSVSFDASAWELYAPLASGGKLVLVGSNDQRDTQSLIDLICRHKVTTLQVVPTLLEALSSNPQFNKCKTLTKLFSGGEVLQSNLVSKVRKCSSAMICNLYGPTESCIDGTYYAVGKHLSAGSVSIGRPLDNTQIYILDRNKQPVPVGVTGELYISGVGLARGYLNHLQLTKEKFVANPFSKDINARLYRTGDLARYSPDGNIEFLGRSDYQVKISGFRIELAEIEINLVQHTAVKEAVVVVSERGNNKRLVAYVVFNKNKIEISDLKDFLKTKLPNYMLPSLFFQLEKLPLAPNGKVDRKALLALDEDSRVARKYQAPSTPTEELVTGICSDVLKVDQVGVNDNFFEMGGHSLLATQMISRIREALNVDVPFKTLFENPCLSILAQTITQLSEKGRKLDRPVIKPIFRKHLLPLSFAQERLWFLDQLEPNRAIYNMPMALRLKGNLDVEALACAVNAIRKRHEALRTVFRQNAGKPYQLVQPYKRCVLSVIDLTQFKQTAELEAKKIAQAQAQKPFDLSQGPLLRAEVLKLTHDIHILHVTMHHIISDGWSMSIFMNELSKFYTAYCDNKKLDLNIPAIQYADFSYWQRQWLTTESLARQLSYWRNQLSNANMVLEVPTDYIRPPVQAYHGCKRTCVLSEKLTGELKRLSKKNNATLFMTLLTAFNILLYRYTGQDDIIIGSPIAGRTLTEIEGLIGVFLNSLALRMRLSSDASFQELLMQQRDVCLAAYANQDIPVEMLIDELKPKRDLSRNSLFQVLFNMLPQDSQLPKLTGLKVEFDKDSMIESKFDLTIYVREAADRIQLQLVYNPDLFKPVRMLEFLNTYELLLSQITANPAKKITDYSLITKSAYKYLPDPTQKLNTTWYGGIHELFSTQAKKNLNRFAIIDKDQRWTYQMLAAYSNKLANYLCVKGIKKNEIVAIYAHRSAALVWALLSVLKAGAAYLILDPAYPFARLKRMLDAAKPKGLLKIEAAGALSEKLTRYVDQHAFTVYVILPPKIPKQLDLLKGFSDKAPNIKINPDRLAYVAFTSGSTGKPKGILGSHGSLSHFIPWQRKTFRFKPGDRFSMLSGLSHDPLQRDIFTCLCSGGSICVPDPEKLGHPGWLADWLKTSKVNIINITPAMGRVITHTKLAVRTDAEKISSLRYAFFVGDVLTREDVLKLQRIAPTVTCINYFGSTETQSALSYLVINYNQVKQAPKEAVPLGGGIVDVQILILNTSGQLASVGEQGEIAIRSPHLAQGYLNDEKLTQARFIMNPYTGNKHDRIYMTGDLGRYQLDGTIEVIGRIDYQVKIRGFRIELGEIEVNLLKVKTVKEAVVVVNEVNGDKRLVAYIVFHKKASEISQLRNFLKTRLPDYMVPGLFIELKKLPLTANGKIDHKALPVPDEKHLTQYRYQAPSTATEALVTGIWSDVLKLKEVGVNDNFFEIGGHSLLATQVISRVNEVFNVDIPLKTLFEYPTVFALAKALTVISTKTSTFDHVPIKPISRSHTLPLSFAQERLWFLDQLQPNSAIYNIPMALGLDGGLNVKALERAIDYLRKRHEALRTVFKNKSGKPEQCIQPHKNLPLPIVDLSCKNDETESKTRILAKKEAVKPFDLSKGPLLRAQLLRFKQQKHILLITMHHIVSDGWSMGIFRRELGYFYQAYCEGRKPNLNRLTIQYADFSFWQRQWLAGKRYDQQLDYWKASLKGVPNLLHLPTDRSRPSVRSHRGAVNTFNLSKTLTQALHKLSQAQDATLFMTLLAVFNILLFHYTQEEHIVVGSPIANRNHREIEGLIGFFVNTLALHTDLSGNPSFIELVKRVRTISLAAFDNQDLPFEHLVEALQPERSMSHHPIFQVMMVLQNNPVSELKLGTVKQSNFSCGTNIAKFDLTLNFVEQDNQLFGSLQYAIDLFNKRTITRMVAHFNSLITAILNNPQESIAKLEMLSAKERKQMLVDWNATAKTYPNDKCIHQLFEEQVKKTPNNIALVYENKKLTYKELNSKANQLAHYLKKLGVKPETLVAICVGRSFNMSIGFWGILKAGGVYMPLDQNTPKLRLQFMLNESKATILLAQNGLVEHLNYSGRIVYLDHDWQKIQDYSDKSPVSNVRLNHLAYVIYTSGSTGKPKGVCIEHRGVVNCSYELKRVVHLSADSSVLQFSSISFDASIAEMLLSALSGCQLHIVNSETRKSASSFSQFLNNNQITTLLLTPAVLQLLHPNELNSVKTIIVMGEKCQTSLIQKWCQQVQFYNFYGPTEVSMWTSYKHLHKSHISSSIGKPIANTQVYILNSAMKPSAVGLCGEIYIGGLGLARGYLNSDKLTKEKFIQNPFSTDPNLRIYKTGDLGRYLFDGNIEFLGRIDNQIKIRGLRIELGEIEVALLKEKTVREAVVVVNEDSDDKRLVAYVVSDKKAIGVSKLRNFLKTTLPDYMLPNLFIQLDKLPLTANGKINRKALPAPDESGLAKQAYLAPSTPTEELIIGIWSDVLKLEQVGVNDNFFEIGGHSLLATQAVSRIRSALNVDVPLQALFESPTVAELAKTITVLVTKGFALDHQPIEPVSRQQLLPLSFAQERLWFLDQLAPNSRVYNIPMALRLEGRINVKALEQAINAIRKRHESLRTLFRSNAGKPKQVIQPHKNISLKVIDLTKFKGTAQNAAEKLAKAEAETPFDLSKGPLLRAQLLKLNQQTHVLLITMHHIVSDGWSMDIFRREFNTFYEAYQTGKQPSIAKLPIQYADFSYWQRQWLKGKHYDQQLDFWKNSLKDVPSLLKLPTDHPRPNVQRYRGANKSFSFSKEMTSMLNKLSREHGATLFMTLLTVFNILLYRYTQEEHIVVGSPIANRNHSEVEAVIGFFVNMLALHTDLSGNPSFIELLKRVRAMSLSAYTHQDLPFEHLVEALQPKRSMSHHPIFQVMMVLQNNPVSEMKLGTVKVSHFSSDVSIAKFDLTLNFVEQNNRLFGSLQYATDLFSKRTIIRMISHFNNLIAGILNNPQENIAKLEMLSVKERKRLLIDWNATEKAYPKNKCIHELFEEQAAMTPDNTALVFQDQQVTYSALNSKANQLAHYLQKQGVKPETLVAICVERSFEMVIGLLGILKAGGAYVPLDPSYPKYRKKFMLEDTQAPFLLTQHGLTESLKHKAKAICLDTEWQKIAMQRTTKLRVKVSSENLAYVIYTSGSTGKPKGVCCQHQGIVSRLDWVQSIIGIKQSDRILQKTPLNFDVSVREIFWPLSVGARLVILPPSLHKDPTYLVNEVIKHKISILNFVPSMLQMFLDEEGICDCNSLRVVISGAEPLTKKLQEKFFSKFKSALYNFYGPTESSINVSYHLCNKNDKSRIVPIGRPIADTRLYIVDRSLNPVPIGVAGELHIGGVGLARSYLNQPKLTAEKFISNPFSKAHKAKLYKTGDLARYLPDGNIEFLGRIDNQVKIRGFRIELGEIETNLVEHKAVKEAAVVVSEMGNDKRLIAYVVSTKRTINVSKLRDFLKAKLPDYMLPNLFIQLEKLPLMPNGKIDRNALLALDEGRLVKNEYLAPSTPTEALVAGIWSDVLKLEQVGVNDNFFEIGGHSLLATQVISRIRTALNVDLPLKALFESPTVSEFGKTVTAMLSKNDVQDRLPIASVSRKQSLPLSFAQERLWFIDQLEPSSAVYNMPMAILLEGKINVKGIEQAINSIRKRHAALRTIFQREAGKAKQVIQPYKNVSLRVIDLTQLKETAQNEAQKLAKAEAAKPFDLANGPLLRAQLLKLNKQMYVLLITMHHIVSDGWSMGIFQRELNVFYEAYQTGKKPSIAKLPIQYADFSYWQRQWLKGKRYEQQLNFWKTLLKHAPSLLKLPIDHPRPNIQCHRGANKDFSFSKETTSALNKLSREQGATLFMTLLTVFNVLLYRYTQEEHIVVGSPIANRNHSEIEGVIGFFINMLALPTDVSGNPSFIELLKRVRAMSLGAYAHQDLPFERLVEALQPERSMSHHPIFQVMMVLQNNPTSEVQLGTAKQNHFSSGVSLAKFDLTLNFVEQDNQLLGSLQYATDLFNKRTITRMVAHFNNLVAAILDNPQASIAKLEMLSAKERKQLLVDWNATAKTYPKDKCLHQLFEEQVTRTPDNIALVFEDQKLTYKSLNSSANRLAHYLKKLGVKPETLVAICAKRSLEMVIGLLGILKVGGAYVPLDPHYPKARIKFILKDTKAPVLLTQRGLISPLAYLGKVVYLDRDWQKIAKYSNKAPVTNVMPDHLAYVIYTSGSTGKPKGVTVMHKNTVGLVHWARAYSGMKACDAVLASTSICFDLSIYELFGPIVNGGTVVLVNDILSLTSSELTYPISLINTVPSVIRQLLANHSIPDSVQTINLAGEALPARLVTELYQRTLVKRVFNLYGPSETTTYTTCSHCLPKKSVTIGKPISNAQLYILDHCLNPVPVGVNGELHLGGLGVAQGYLNRPKLTKEKFIQNPFSTESNSRLYKTGDLARYLPDGNIELLGRIDNQVKIRGFRIELGEIEVNLIKYKTVKEAAVIACKGNTGNKRLVAYYVTDKKVEITTDQLRDFLKTKLPEYMLPSLFVNIEQLPLTTNGKVDRRALANLEASVLAPNQAYVPPQNQKEKMLAQIWSKVLGLEKISIQDNFFEIGGDSIISIQIVAKAAAAGLHITPRQLFEHQTIAGLAQVAKRGPYIKTEQGLVSGRVPLTPIQHWFFEKNVKDKHHWNQARLLNVRRDLDKHVLKKAIKKLIEHHDSLRLRFSVKKSGWQQAISSAEKSEVFVTADLSKTAVDRLPQKLATIATKWQASLDLEHGPIIRAVFFNLPGKMSNRLLLIIHHLAVDGVSWRILLEDLQSVCEQLFAGQQMSLPAKTTSYQDWAKALLIYANSRALVTQRAHWLNFTKVIKTAQLPFQRSTQYLNTAANARNYTVSLSIKETQALLQVVPEVYHTQINDILLLTLIKSMTAWSGNDTLFFDLEGHGREDIGDTLNTSRTVGWFTSIFPVLLKLETQDELGGQIKSIKEQLRQIPNKGIGYSVLSYLRHDKWARRFKSTPTAEINFNYHGQFDQVFGSQNESADKKSVLFSAAKESAGRSHSPKAPRTHLIDINGLVRGQQLDINWCYCPHAIKTITLTNIANDYIKQLRAIIKHCLRRKAGGSA